MINFDAKLLVKNKQRQAQRTFKPYQPWSFLRHLKASLIVTKFQVSAYISAALKKQAVTGQ